MMAKCIIFVVLALFALVQGGAIPAAVVAPYASSYNAHAINHAISAPIVAAAPAPLVAAAPAAYSALPAAYSALPAAYSALPATYSGLPAAYSAFPGAYSALPAANYVL